MIGSNPKIHPLSWLWQHWYKSRNLAWALTRKRDGSHAREIQCAGFWITAGLLSPKYKFVVNIFRTADSRTSGVARAFTARGSASEGLHMILPPLMRCPTQSAVADCPPPPQATPLSRTKLTGSDGQSYIPRRVIEICIFPTAKKKGFLPTGTTKINKSAPADRTR